MGGTQGLFLKLYNKRNEKKVLLTDAELQKLKKILIDMTEKNATGINFLQMRNYLIPYMHIKLIERLYEAMQWRHAQTTSKRKLERTNISPIAFVYVIANLLKGDLLQKAAIIRYMVGGRDLDYVTSIEICNFLKDLITEHLQSLARLELGIDFDTSNDENAKENLALALMHDLVDPDNVFENKLPLMTRYDDEDLSKWLEFNPIILLMIFQIFYPAFPIHQFHWQFQSFLPNFINDDEFDSCSGTMLDIPSIIFLNTHIPKQSNKPHEWMLLCSSLDVDEITFETLVSCCLRYENTLFIIEDSDLYRFGGFSSDKLFAYPKFRGSGGCFLFTLLPYMAFYKSTGINKNWVYINDSYDEGPKCIGFGGSIGFLGFSIQSDCVTGASYPTLTYNSPQLSAKTNFNVSKIEIWAVFRSNAMRVQGWRSRSTCSDKQYRQYTPTHTPTLMRSATVSLANLDK